MTANADEGESAPKELDDVLAELMIAVDRGETARISELLERYPQFAKKLRAYLANEKRFKHLVEPLI